ncbi:MAG: hypothetical protein K2W94_08175 [Alphaproteobacteria bacterium]|nr:hypothetical protein [Alphaproteobacteria bacterium]
MSVSHQKKSDAQKALWKNPAYREKMIAHHKVKQDKEDCPLSREEEGEFKSKPESSKLQDFSKSRGESDFLKGYPVFQ